MAAKKAFARSAFRDASEYFEIAMDAVDKQPASTAREQRAIDLRVEARLAFAALGKIEEWFRLGRDAEARSEKIGDEHRRLASIAARAGALNFYGTPYEATVAGEQAVALALQLNDVTWLGFAEYGLGQSYFLSGRYRDAELSLAQACARLTASPQHAPPGTTASNLLVLCCMMKAIVHATMGEFVEAERCSGQASDLAESSGRPYERIAAGYARGLVQTLRGNLDAAESALEQALFLSRENEVHGLRPLVMCALGNLYLQQGRPARARDTLLEAKSEAEVIGHGTSIMYVAVYLASAHSELGEVSHGLTLMRASQASARQKGYGGVDALAIFSEAAILSTQDAPALKDAMACLNRTIEMAGRLEARPLLGAARAMRARLLAASGRVAEAQDEMAQAITLFDQSKMTIHLERAKVALSKFSHI
jgi:tetratricopeptide (TPR) repeat protein